MIVVTKQDALGTIEQANVEPLLALASVVDHLRDVDRYGGFLHITLSKSPEAYDHGDI